jgi:cystathionine beta-lyase/cystathionine gamma-synthase
VFDPVSFRRTLKRCDSRQVLTGGVESLIGSPAVMTCYEMEPEERKAPGIEDNLVRVAGGVEDADDLTADLEQALGQI